LHWRYLVRRVCDSIPGMTSTPDSLPDDIDALRAALAAEQPARREAEARAAGAEAMVAHLQLLIAKLKHDKYGASSERGRKLIDQLELELGELVAAASEDAAKAEATAGKDARSRRPDRPPRGQPVRAPLPARLPRERVVLPGPTACPCCGGKLSKLGEDITETLEVEPIKWRANKVEGDPDRPRAVLLPLLRGHHPATGAIPPHRPRPGGAEPAGDDPGGQVRPAPAAQPPE
jgi:Transposase C of IS166 homeodomain/zinc-finger binding domain of transposase IS66